MITKSENSVNSLKRDTLYFGHRYRVGSYKSRKAGIEPTLMSASREGSGSIRIYALGGDIKDGLSSGLATPIQERFAITRFKQWRQQERELRRKEKLEARRQK